MTEPNATCDPARDRQDCPNHYDGSPCPLAPAEPETEPEQPKIGWAFIADMPPGAWVYGKAALNGHSAPTWVIGHGHAANLTEARALAIGRLAQAEAEVVAQAERVQALDRARAQATRDYEYAHGVLVERQRAVALEQSHLSYILGLDAQKADTP